MTESREQIKMRLWMEVYSASAKIGCHYCATVANNALKNFDEQFPEKQNNFQVLQATCFSCGELGQVDNMVPCYTGYTCLNCLKRKSGQQEEKRDPHLAYQTGTPALFAVGQRVRHKRSGATGTLREISSGCCRADWDDRTHHYFDCFYANELEPIP